MRQLARRIESVKVPGRGMSMSVPVKRLADHVLQTLTTARYISTSAAIQELGPLREMVGSGQDVERERAEAWLAICVLYETLSEKARNPDIDARWQKAIDKTAAWVATLT
jgi:hypothetical protein